MKRRSICKEEIQNAIFRILTMEEMNACLIRMRSDGIDFGEDDKRVGARLKDINDQIEEIRKYFDKLARVLYAQP